MLQRINLVPQLPLAERLKKLTMPLVGGSLALIVLYLTVSAWFLGSRLDQLSKELGDAKQHAGEIISDQAKVIMLTNDLTKLKEKRISLNEVLARLTSQDGGRKLPFSKLLSAIVTAVPPSIRCEKLTFAKGAGLISGTALRYQDVPVFVKQLNKLPLFSYVALQDLAHLPETQHQDFTFTIVFQLTGEPKKS